MLVFRHTDKCKEECEILLKFHHPEGTTFNVLVSPSVVPHWVYLPGEVNKTML